MKRRFNLALAVAVFGIVVLGGATWFGWRLIVAHAIAVASVPPVPDLTGWPPQFSNRLADASQSARSFLSPSRGLAELSRLYHANGFSAEAIQCYRSLIRLEPDNARWPHSLADVYASYGRLEEALPCLERAVTLAPGFAPSGIRLGDARFKSNQPEASASAYSAVLSREPRNPYALLGLARCRIEANDWIAARDRLQEAVAGQTDTFGGWALLASVHEHFGDNVAADTARQHAKSAGRFREMPDPWLDGLIEDCYDAYRLSVTAAVTTDKPTARRWLERAILLAPAAGSYHRQLGKMLWGGKDYPAARAHLEQAVALDPEDSDAWTFLVDLLVEQRDTVAADRALSAGLSHCPQSGALHYLNGKRFRAAGRFAEARSELEAAQKLQPNEARFYLELALVCFAENRVEEGIAQVRTALAVEPRNRLALQVMTRHAIHTGDESAARRCIRTLGEQPDASGDLKLLVNEYTQEFGHAPR